MTFKIFVLALLLLGVLVACEKEEDLIKDNLTESYFNLTNHCDEFGFVKFDSDGGGSMFYDQECVVGYECQYVLPIEWSLSGNRLTVDYINNTATVICSDFSPEEIQIPVSESINFTESTKTLVLQGLTFKK